ncbi:hypothetical protein ACTMTI_21215 [Nonomuraea sp. H19]|uniref:hypothetical protein n=1 Tax=Nonomuraea sp. H19 TaxID=3452206 RepID=UPI003F8BA2DC
MAAISDPGGADEDLATAGNARRSGPEAVCCREELAKLLVEQYARADVSLRAIQAKADKSGGTRLPRATCSDMLAGRRFPKKAVMIAFLRACSVPEDQLPAWEQAWERVAVAQIPATAGPERSAKPAPGPSVESSLAPAAPSSAPEPAHVRRSLLRRSRIVSAALGTVAALVFVAVVGSQVSGDEVGPSSSRTVTDDGRAFGPGGSSRFTVVISPDNEGVRLTRRLDAGIAMQTASVAVNGDMAGLWQPLSGAVTYRWRDQTVDLPLPLTAGRRLLTITNTFVSSAQDFNEFTYFIEHKLNGIWSRADTVDVGPGHSAGEVAHQYRITCQTWAGTRTFDYLQ